MGIGRIAAVGKLISEQNNILLRLAEPRKKRRGNKHLQQENGGGAKGHKERQKLAPCRDNSWPHLVPPSTPTTAKSNCYMMSTEHAGSAATKRARVPIVKSLLPPSKIAVIHVLSQSSSLAQKSV